MWLDSGLNQQEMGWNGAFCNAKGSIQNKGEQL